MKKSILICSVLVLAMAFFVTNSFAQPSAKATAQFLNIQSVSLGARLANCFFTGHQNAQL